MNMSFIVACLTAFGAATAAGGEVNRTSHKIPLSYLRSSGLLDAMKDAKLYTEFLKKQNRNGHPLAKDSNGTERSARKVGSNVGCDPHQQIVALENDRPDVILYPSCIYLQQCGGCCAHSAFQCKPVQTQTKLIPVDKWIYDGVKFQSQNKTETISIEEHLHCACQCRINETDCNLTVHEYDSFNCQCKCKVEQQQCAAHKRWNENVCACTCADVRNCGPGHFYNTSSCGCEPQVERSRLLRVPLDNSRGNVQPTSTVEPSPKTPSCGHLSCPRRYEVQVSGGICRCKYVGRRG